MTPGEMTLAELLESAGKNAEASGFHTYAATLCARAQRIRAALAAVEPIDDFWRERGDVPGERNAGRIEALRAINAPDETPAANFTGCTFDTGATEGIRVDQRQTRFVCTECGHVTAGPLVERGRLEAEHNAHFRTHVPLPNRKPTKWEVIARIPTKDLEWRDLEIRSDGLGEVTAKVDGDPLPCAICGGNGGPWQQPCPDCGRARP